MGTTEKKDDYRPRPVLKISLNSWNAYSRRFVDPPVFTWDAVPGTASYEVMIAYGDQMARSHKVDRPCIDLSPDWGQVPFGPVDMLLLGRDSTGREICISQYKGFHKVHDFDGVRQEPLDWAKALRDNAAYLLSPARDEVYDFERGLPRACWMSMEDSVTGQRWSNWVMPGLYHTSHIFAFLAFAGSFPDEPLAREARDHARVFGDWLLQNRTPQGWAYGLYPYSNVGNGQLKESVRGTTVTRAGRVGIGMLALYREFGEEAYLGYARYLADTLVRTQRRDGSWPFRVSAEDGSVTGDYTSDAVTPARLSGLLEEIGPDERYLAARYNAVEWMLRGPVRTNRWEGMYEDTGDDIEPYVNLENLDTNEMIRYLVHFRDQSPDYLKTAERLNRWIEDQFVVWRPEDCAAIGLGDVGNTIGSKNLRCPTPTVSEQYKCDFPMEGHTGNWLVSLLALHKATGKEEYRLKGIAAANSIVRGQQESGAFSTWGFDTRFGRPLSTLNWPGDNACGHVGLALWRRYYNALQAGEPFELGLWGL